MIGNITPDFLKERAFQTVIKDYLIQDNGYIESFNKDYDRTYALDKKCLFEFLELTQEKAMKRLKEIYGNEYQSKVLSNLVRELRNHGSLYVLKKGIKDYGVKLNLAYFKPPTDLNPEQMLLYRQNIISVTEELVYDASKADRIDLVVFLNGIPIVTMELKNSFTGQTCKDAIRQYKNDRSNKEQIFAFKQRSLVNFAVDTGEVYMATRLSGKSTFFLPFNKGNNGGAGNPIIENKLKTHYLWEEVLKKDSLLEIIHKFIFIEKKERLLPSGAKRKSETVIFPRYHQLDSVRKVISHAKENRAGNKYLIQHSAGSGKTFSITWLAHRLASLHDKNNEIIFNGVIVVTDRRILDRQLQDAIYQMEHKIGMVAKIQQGSTQLADEIEKGTPIIISTIQKFPFVLEKLESSNDKRYAIIIDEAHSSTSGTSMTSLKASLSLEEAEDEAIKEESEESDAEDMINTELSKITNTSNLSFFAFTATPKPTTLRIFGTPYAIEAGNEVKYKAFHNYSMRQAIEEEFILDVLKHYMTYKMYYKVNKKISDDPQFDKSRATKEIVRYVTLHAHNISQKTEIIIEHFRNNIMKQIGGEAKAMLVTSSRLHAVKYKLAFDKYIKEKGYSELKTFVAFSGTVSDDGIERRESAMNNGVSESNLAAEFDKEESRILIVANKYQTGFDQPKLHTMYVDKKLSGVKAVQTLSRLNRTCSGKENTFVLDFVNEPEDIQKSFQPFYQTTILDNDIEPNDIYVLQKQIEDMQIINEDDVIKFTDMFYKSKKTVSDASPMHNYVAYSLKRMKDFTREETIDFRNLCKKFINMYSLIIQISPFVDTELHRLSIYLRYLIKAMEVEAPQGIDITDKVILEYYKLVEKEAQAIKLDAEGETGVEVQTSGTTSAATEKLDTLSEIIKVLNERYGKDFGESEKLATKQIFNSLEINESLGEKARQNTYEDFQYAFEPAFLESVIAEFDKNQSFYGKILQDSQFKNLLMGMVMEDIYQSHRQRVKD